ncbi:ASKHA domain-containing protein [Ruminococcus sp.]|uniref:ASKHA domain-containing protein n=1 Tax=Ruminococcus sp. TaxID=41978 RepID=UPI0025D2B54F|nr:ASKHA domain-containing protein [Ruminococcus sp.]
MGNKIIFQPFGVQCVDASSEETLLQIAQRAGVGIDAACGGAGACGKCKLRVIFGTFEGYGIHSDETHLTEMTAEEYRLLSETERQEGVRLACMTCPRGDLVIEVPQKSRLAQQVVLSDGKSKAIPLHPAVHTYCVTLPKATLEDHRDDASRLCDTLHAVFPALSETLELDLAVLRQLPRVLQKGHWRVSVTVWQNKRIIGVQPGTEDGCYGVAIDIGTTTIAAYLCDCNTGETVQVASMMNPQVRFGDDVLARVSHCMLQEKSLEQLHEILMDGLNKLTGEMAEKQGISPEQIGEFVLVCNPVMHHIALAIPPDSLGASPFAAVSNAAIDVPAKEIGLVGMAGANVHMLPLAAGFVGADHVAVLIAEEPHQQEEMQLVIDIGTNSEICLGNQEHLYVTSCATGPALEGAHIQCGMRAADGAIERVTIDPETLEPTLRLIGDQTIPQGICGSGILDAVAQMAHTGILEPSGRFSKTLQSERIRMDAKGKPEYVLYFARSPLEHDIVVTAKDVRAVQLAKAALYAGAKALMQQCGSTQISAVTLAGAFGSYIDRHSALQLGMFPDCPAEQISVSGNAAGVGARYALLNVEKRQEAQWLAEHVVFVETAMDAEFQMMFSDAMWIPHKKDHFANS